MQQRTAAGGARYRFVIAAAILLLNTSMGMSFLSVAPLFPLIIDEYGVDRATASLLVGASSLVVALALVPCSIVAARLGTRVSLALGGALIATVAFAPLVPNFGLLLGTRLAFAVGAALVLGATPTVVMRWFAIRELPIVNGMNVVGQSLGVTFSMFMAPRLADRFGWSGALFAFGCVAMAGTVLWLLVGREAKVAPEQDVAPSFSLRDMPLMLRDRATVLLGLGVAGALGAYITFSSWLPTYYTEQFGYTLEKAGSLGALLSACGIVGALLGSTLPARFPRRRPFLIVAGLLLPVAAFGCFVAESPLVLYPSIAMFGLLGWVFMPVVFTIPMELPRMTPERVGVVVAIVLSAGNLSGFVAPLAVGFVRDVTGSFAIGLGAIAFAAFGLAACGWLMPETGGRERSAARTTLDVPEGAEAHAR